MIEPGGLDRDEIVHSAMTRSRVQCVKEVLKIRK